MTTPTDAMNPEETPARWRAEEVAVRARLQTAPGVASPAQVAARSGLQIFQALLAGEIPPPPMAVTLDFTLLRIERAFAVFQGRPGFSYYNPMGTVHGGGTRGRAAGPQRPPRGDRGRPACRIGPQALRPRKHHLPGLWPGVIEAGTKGYGQARASIIAAHQESRPLSIVQCGCGHDEEELCGSAEGSFAASTPQVVVGP